jgi:ATP-binding cassette subfamily B protein
MPIRPPPERRSSAPPGWPTHMTSSSGCPVDSHSEALIQDAMQRLMQGRRCIAIAHRLSTVRALDRILVFDRGQVVEEGSHAALMRVTGPYRALFTHQTAGLLEV